jgi:hypothetical protein
MYICDSTNETHTQVKPITGLDYTTTDKLTRYQTTYLYNDLTTRSRSVLQNETVIPWVFTKVYSWTIL